MPAWKETGRKLKKSEEPSGCVVNLTLSEGVRKVSWMEGLVKPFVSHWAKVGCQITPTSPRNTSTLIFLPLSIIGGMQPKVDMALLQMQEPWSSLDP